MSEAGNLPTIKEAERFHGHLCPGLALGYRVARAALATLGCERPKDEELVAVVENNSCAVDAVQVVCGCTFGKGNLVFRDNGKHVYTFYDRKTGRAVRVSENYRGLEDDAQLDELRNLMVSGEATREQQAEFSTKWRTKAEAILHTPADGFLTVTEVSSQPPPKARMESSEQCVACQELTMVSRLLEVGGRKLCRECALKAGSELAATDC